MSFVRNINHRRAISVGVLGGLLPFAALADNSLTLEDSIVTASQTAHSQLSAPASVSVVTRAELDKMPVYDLADAVKRLPGVHINNSSGYGRKEIKLRGMDSDYTLLLVNGRRINSRDALTSNYANDFDLSSIPMAAVERIEVIRGPMSSLYGADALGGVVNVILRQPTNKTAAGVAASYENPTKGDEGDIFKSSAYISGALIENTLLGNLIVESTDQEAWQTDQLSLKGTDATEQRRGTNALGTMSWLLDEQQSIDLDISHREDDREANWNNSLAPLATRLTTNFQNMERTTFGLAHNGNWDRFNSRVRYYYEDVDLTDDSQIMTALRGRAGEVEQKNHTLDGQISTTLGSHLLTTGAEYRRTTLEHSQNLGKETEVDQKAIYLQDEFSLGALDITLAGRWDDHEVYGGAFSPRIYGVYNLTDNWVIKGGAGKAFKAPSISQSDPSYGVLACRGYCTVFGNADLKPEKSTSYELGTLWQNERLEAGIMFFNNDIKDLIATETTTLRFVPGVGPVAVNPNLTYYNQARTRIQGYELQGRYAFTNTFAARANYTYSDSQDRDTGDQLDYTPQHTANIGLDWQAMAKLGFNLDYQYTGSQILMVPAGNQLVREETGAYSTLSLGGNFQATKELTLKAGLNNMTNTKRDEVAQAADHILMGRTFYLGFSYDI
ncbi:TonB-dependent receptor domain-containing protein [Pseudomonas anguilliseptica]|uniref:TonB-dependent receptor domain-containing protein n=1 Tax=Pseudomonas anguilliseptica TaxID=53406 RepID=UPI0022AF6D0A|nr:TonB-dependent receptor [Pseudomonas anguilliseptica]MCZ4324232.1 TonB-dependent receptor [Pseudomonas anguilliseptica]